MTYISWSSDFYLSFFALKNILVLLAKPDSGELCCPATALIYKEQSSENGLSSKPCHFVKKNIFSASDFFMHTFNMSVMCPENIKGTQIRESSGRS